jgi:hypothetical protein
VWIITVKQSDQKLIQIKTADQTHPLKEWLATLPLDFMEGLKF